MSDTPTYAKLEAYARPLFPRGVHDIVTLVRTAVTYRNRDGHVKIGAHGAECGRWGWFAAAAPTALAPRNGVWHTISFPADHRRTAAQARRELMRALEDLRWDAKIPEDA